MWKQPQNDQFAQELYLAGERVPPGRYKQVEGRRIITLDHEDILPARLDGCVARYVRILPDWGQRIPASAPIRISD
jgi:hypothetical protein